MDFQGLHELWPVEKSGNAHARHLLTTTRTLAKQDEDDGANKRKSRHALMHTWVFCSAGAQPIPWQANLLVRRRVRSECPLDRLTDCSLRLKRERARMQRRRGEWKKRKGGEERVKKHPKNHIHTDEERLRECKMECKLIAGNRGSDFYHRKIS